MSSKLVLEMIEPKIMIFGAVDSTPISKVSFYLTDGYDQSKLDGNPPPCCPKERNKGEFSIRGSFLVRISADFPIV